MPDTSNVDVGYSIDGGKEQFKIRSKGKSRRTIICTRAEAEKVRDQLDAYLSFDARARVEPVTTKES